MIAFCFWNKKYFVCSLTGTFQVHPAEALKYNFHNLNILSLSGKKIVYSLMIAFQQNPLGFKMTIRGHIFSHVQPFCKQAVRDLERSMHRSLRV